MLYDIAKIVAISIILLVATCVLSQVGFKDIITRTFATLSFENEDSFNATGDINPENDVGNLNATGDINPENDVGNLNATGDINPETESNSESIVNISGESGKPINEIPETSQNNNTSKESNNALRDPVSRNGQIASLYVNTNKNSYVTDQVIEIFGNVKYTSAKSLSTKIILEVKNTASNAFTYKSAKFTASNGNFLFKVHSGSPGMYNVTVTLPRNGISESASTLFGVTDLFLTRTAIMLYTSLGFLAALLLLIVRGTRSTITDEILRFVFLSGIVGSILLSLIFTDLQVGLNSPLGLVVKQTNHTLFTHVPLTENQWVLNIGGDDGSTGVYTGGIQIPVYVLVFGLVGGYLRYLYKTSRLLTDPGLKKERLKIKKILQGDNNTKKKINTLLVFYQSLRDIALFFLAPLLAIAAWFILAQWQTTAYSVYTLAVVSFAAGLITDEIVETIIRFTKRLLKEGSSKTEEETDKTEEETDKTEEETDKTEEETDKTEEETDKTEEETDKI